MNSSDHVRCNGCAKEYERIDGLSPIDNNDKWYCFRCCKIRLSKLTRLEKELVELKKKDPDSFYQDDIDELLQAVGITNV